MKAPIAVTPRSADKSTLNFCRPSADTGCQTRLSLLPQRRVVRPDVVGARETGLMRITTGIIQRTALANLQIKTRRVCAARSPRPGTSSSTPAA